MEGRSAILVICMSIQHAFGVSTSVLSYTPLLSSPLLFLLPSHPIPTTKSTTTAKTRRVVCVTSPSELVVVACFLSTAVLSHRRFLKFVVCYVTFSDIRSPYQ
ncbi:hypothetical protein BKA70DRAFT_257538 [Coprinopsis sp. MPI-PUGE-AT-0042]|nr:hypothetical protein BKA70DRAFT_257538 [Coprinopsis sp. MPI-PUGE-AT-0042]